MCSALGAPGLDCRDSCADTKPGQRHLCAVGRTCCGALPPWVHVELLMWRLRPNAMSMRVNGSPQGELAAAAAAVGTGAAAPRLAVWLSCLQLKDDLQRNWKRFRGGPGRPPRSWRTRPAGRFEELRIAYRVTQRVCRYWAMAAVTRCSQPSVQVCDVLLWL